MSQGPAGAPRPCPTCGRADAIAAQFPRARACVECGVSGWPHLEPRYANGVYVGTGEIPGQVRFIDGDPAVIFTSTNGVHYFSGAEQMPANRRTGSAVEVLAALTGYRSLSIVREPLGPAADGGPTETIRSALIARHQLDTFVIDIKGMADRNTDVGVALGPLPGPREEAFADFTVARFGQYGIRAAVNVPFAARTSRTVTYFCQETLGVPGVQVALGAWMRDPAHNPTMAKLALSVLRDAAAHIATS